MLFILEVASKDYSRFYVAEPSEPRHVACKQVQFLSRYRFKSQRLLIPTAGGSGTYASDL